MVKNFIKVTLRNITRHRAFSFINILGLTVGLATSLLIFMYVYERIGCLIDSMDYGWIQMLHSSHKKSGKFIAVRITIRDV